MLDAGGGIRQLMTVSLSAAQTAALFRRIHQSHRDEQIPLRTRIYRQEEWNCGCQLDFEKHGFRRLVGVMHVK